MKKRIIILSVITAMSILMAGCNNDGNKPADTPYVSEEMTTAPEAEVTSEATTSAETTEAIKEEISKLTFPKGASLKRINFFSGNNCLFEMNYSPNTSKYYIYRIAEKELVEPKIPEGKNVNIVDISGDSVLCYQAFYGDDEAPNTNKNVTLMNFITGEIYAQGHRALAANHVNSNFISSGGPLPQLPNRKSAHMRHQKYFHNDKVAIMSIERTLKDDTFAIGVINNKGEWISPMSSDRACLNNNEYNFIDENVHVSEDTLRFDDNYIVCNNIENPDRYLAVYDIENNEVCFKTEAANRYGIVDYYIKNDKLYIIPDTYMIKALVFDLKTKEPVDFYPSETAKYVKHFGSYEVFIDGIVDNRAIGNKVIVYNTDTEQYTTYDLAPHDITIDGYYLIAAADDRIFFGYSDESRNYNASCILTADGKLTFQDVDLLWRTEHYLKDDNRIFCTNGNDSFMYDLNTGDYKYFDFLTQSIGYNPYNDTVITSYTDETNLYIANFTDPGTPIFPADALDSFNKPQHEFDPSEVAPDASKFDTNEPK